MAEKRFSDGQPLASMMRRFGLILWTDGPNRRFEFEKRSQLFIGMHNVTFPIAAMRVSNCQYPNEGVRKL